VWAIQPDCIVSYKIGFDHTSLSPFYLKKLTEVIGIYRHVGAVATGTLSVVEERSGHEADHSPPPSAEVKMSRVTPPLSLHTFMACTGSTLTCWRSAVLVVAVGVLRLTATDFKGWKSFTQPFTCVALMKREHEWIS
jgi:hypothetical protein